MPIYDTDRMPPVRWLHLGFALTGVGTTIFGCALPALSTVWHLDDSRAGVLFAAQFSGSALGALLVQGNFFGSVMSGYFLLIASVLSLTLCTGQFLAIPFFSFGLGLGLTMTATSMLIGSLRSGRRGSALSLLNASWTAGAVACPVIAWLWISYWPPVYLFLVLAAALAVTAFFIWKGQAVSTGRNSDLPTSEWGRAQLALVCTLAGLAFLYVGVESSLSGWMMTYVHRARNSSSLWPPIATSGFWVALLCGRAVAAAVLRRLSEAQLFASSLIIAFAGIVSLLLSHTPGAIVLFAMLTGFALGPIFPLCLARVLELMNNSPGAKWVFAVSGLGGALFPWITGQVSARHGSLRFGLAVPGLALALMIALYAVECSGLVCAEGSGVALIARRDAGNR